MFDVHWLLQEEDHARLKTALPDKASNVRNAGTRKLGIYKSLLLASLQILTVTLSIVLTGDFRFCFRDGKTPFLFMQVCLILPPYFQSLRQLAKPGRLAAPERRPDHC